MSDVREKVAGARFTERYGAGAWGRASESVRRSWIDSEANTEFCRILEALPTEPTREPEQGEDKQWTEVVTLHQPGGSRYAAAIQIGPTLFTLAPHLYVASAQDEAKHLDYCLKSLVRRRSSPQEGREDEAYALGRSVGTYDEHGRLCDLGVALRARGWHGPTIDALIEHYLSGTAVEDLPREGDAGEALRCQKCGFALADVGLPRYAVRYRGEMLVGGLPVGEMMQRGWIPTRDPADPDTPTIVLDDLTEFFDHDVELVALNARSQPEQGDGREVVDVVAAVRRDAEGRVWLARRNANGAHGGLAGMWEYPGGKVEPDEQLREALVREMDEEFCDIGEVTVGRVLDSIPSDVGDGTVYRVTFFEVEFERDPTEYSGHSEVRWMTPDEACAVDHLPSGTIFNARHLAGRPAPPTPSTGDEQT